MHIKDVLCDYHCYHEALDGGLLQIPGEVRLVGTSMLTSMFEKIHATTYLHKSMLNDSTHIEHVVHRMEFQMGPP